MLLSQYASKVYTYCSQVKKMKISTCILHSQDNEMKCVKPLYVQFEEAQAMVTDFKS